MPQLKFYQDFPKKGVNFLDIFSITSNPAVFKLLLDAYKRMIVEKVG